jgi:hypothetical protein
MADRTAVFLIDITEDDQNSNEIPLGNDALYAIEMPSAWTAGNITVKGKINVDATARNVLLFDYSDGTQDVLTIVSPAVDTLIFFDPPIRGLYSVQLYSAAAQLADRTITPRFHRFIPK